MDMIKYVLLIISTIFCCNALAVNNVLALLGFRDGVLTAFDNNRIYFSQDGYNLGSSEVVYSAGARLTNMATCQDGVISVFKGTDAYFDNGVPLKIATSGADLAGKKVWVMYGYNEGVVTDFGSGNIIYSPDCKTPGTGSNINPNGIPNAKLLYAGKHGIYTTFGQLIRRSVGGNSIDSGVVVYEAGGHINTMADYKDGVLSAFFNNPVYQASADNIGAGTHRYSPGDNVRHLIEYNGDVINAMSNGRIYRTDFENQDTLGAGEIVYKPPVGADEKWKCEVSWYFSTLQSTRTFEGFGANRSSAIDQARDRCVVGTVIDDWDHYCKVDPVSENCFER